MVLLRSLVNINCGYKMRCSQRAGVSWHYHRHGTDLGSLCACRCCGWAPPQPRSVATGSPQVGVSRCAHRGAAAKERIATGVALAPECMSLPEMDTATL